MFNQRLIPSQSLTPTLAEEKRPNNGSLSIMEQSYIKDAIRTVVPVKLHSALSSDLVVISSNVVAFFDHDLELVLDYSASGVDSWRRKDFVRILNVNDGTFFEAELREHVTSTIYPLTEDYFAVAQSRGGLCDITFYSTKDLKIHHTITQNAGAKKVDFFFRSIFDEENKLELSDGRIRSYLYRQEFWSDHNKLFATKGYITHNKNSPDNLLNKELNTYEYSFQLTEDKIVSAEKLFILRTGFVAAHFTTEKCIKVFEVQLDRRLKELKVIPNVLEVAEITLPDDSLVYRSDKIISILAASNFSTRFVTTISEPILKLQVMFDGSISFFTKQDEKNLKVTVYRVPKVYVDKHEIIYQAASKAQTDYLLAEQELITILSGKFVSVDIFDQHEMSPAARLAKEGKIESVKLLRKYGANINQIAKGAAMGTQPMAEVLQREGANVNYLAFGAAYAGNLNYAEYLRNDHGANINFIAQGAAMNSSPACREYAELLRTQYDANVNFIAAAAARTGNNDYAEILRLQHNANIDFIARGAAGNTDNTYAELLRTKHGANVNFMVEGAAQRKQYVYAKFLCRVHGAGLNELASGAAYAGDQEYVNDLLLTYPRVTFTYVAKEIAIGGHQNIMQYFLSRCERLNSAGCAGPNSMPIAEMFLMGAGLGGHQQLGDLHELINNPKKPKLLYYHFVSGGHGQYFDFNHRNENEAYNIAIQQIAVGGQLHYLKLLPNVDKKDLLKAIYQSGHWYYAIKILNDENQANENVSTLFPINRISDHLHDYRDPESNAIADSTDNLNQDSYTIANIIHKFNFNHRSLLHLMRFAHSNILSSRLSALCSQPKLFNQAQAIKSLSNTYNYNQCLALGVPEMIFMFVKFIDKPRPLLALIATFLAPLNQVEASDMVDKLRTHYYSKFNKSFFKTAQLLSAQTKESPQEFKSPASDVKGQGPTSQFSIS